MVETRDLEVYAIEISQLTSQIVEDFLCCGFEYMVLLDQGVYAGILNVEILKLNGQCMSDKIVWNENVFEEARRYFDNFGNRKKYLALVDERGNLLTFLIWNQKNERTKEYLKKQQQKLLLCIKGGYTIKLENWNEYTNLYYQFLLKYVEKERIILTGTNWELCDGYRENSDSTKKDSVISADFDGVSIQLDEPMVKSFLVFSEKYHSNRIFFWLDSLLCMYNLSQFIFEYGCQPDGYCELSERRELETFLGRKVVSIETIAQQEDVIIIVTSNKEVEYLSSYIAKDQIVVYGELITFDATLMETKTYQTWGTIEELNAFRKNIAGIHMHIPYRNFADEKNEAEGILLWEDMLDKRPETFREYMSQVNGNVLLYSKKKVFETHGMTSGMLKIKNFNMALERKKKFIIYGIQSHYTNQWIHIMELYHINYEFMDEVEIENWNGYYVNSIFDLPFYNVNDIFVIINKPYYELKKASRLLREYGISFELNNAISIYEEIDNQNRGENFIDICAGPVPQSMVQGSYPCYKLIGKDDQDDYKIMIVGGSTSDSTLYTYRSWPEELYQICCNNEERVTIYNGAVGGYYSMQELAKVMRDARKIKPDLIISFSGTNDAGLPDLQYGYVNGLIEQNSEYNFGDWLENEKMMLYIAERLEAHFICFAQPQLYQKKNLNMYEKLFTRCIRNGVDDIDQKWKQKVKSIKGYSWFVDLTDILDEHTDVFFDVAHVITEGNKIIAQYIYNYIKNRNLIA